jgi:hypothetical protein
MVLLGVPKQVMFEEVNEEWAKSRFPSTSNPGLTKCGSAPLTYNGDSPSNYSDLSYEVDLGSKNSVRTNLISLIKVINITDDNIFIQELAKIFDIRRFLRYMVVEYLISNPDGYSWYNNNYWLYIDLTTKNITYVPYDQEDWYAGYIYTADIWEKMTPSTFFLNCSHCEPHPLSARLYALNTTEFSEILSSFVSLAFGSEDLHYSISKFQALISQQLCYESWYSLDKLGVQNSTTYVTNVIPALESYIRYKTGNQTLIP